MAYYQEDASLYCVDLSHTFCYLVQGKTRSGKSVLMRNLACAARDTGGKIYVVDREDQSERSLAELVDGIYYATAEELFQLTKELILLTNERGGKRKELMAQGLEEEEIFQAMQSFPPVYVFVADLNDYLQRIYSGQGVLKSVASAMENITMIYQATGRIPQRIGNRYESTYPYDVFPAKDGDVVIAAGNNKLYGLLCDVMQRPELKTDSRFAEIKDRVANHVAMREAICAWTRNYTIDEIDKLLNDAGCPACPVNTIDRLVTDPQIAGAREMFPVIDQPGIGKLQITAVPQH